MTPTASRPLTPYQYRKMKQMAQKEDWGTLHIHGLFTLPSGDIYIQFSKGNGAAPPTHILQHTHVLYALPLGALGSKDVLLYELPRVCFNVVAYDTPPYPLKALAYDLVADDYYQITKKDIVAIELEHIKVEAEIGKAWVHIFSGGDSHMFFPCVMSMENLPPMYMAK